MSNRLGDTLVDWGRAEGQLVSCRTNLLDILTDRFGSVSDELRRRIAGCTDLERLRTAVRQSWRVRSPEEITLDPPMAPGSEGSRSE